MKQMMITKQEFDWLVDELLKIPTVKIYGPMGDYDFNKVLIGTDELYKFLSDTHTQKKMDDSIKESFINKMCDKLYAKFTQEQINEIAVTAGECFNS